MKLAQSHRRARPVLECDVRCRLVDHLRRAGFTLFDTQFITPHLATLGAVEIPRAAYRRRLEIALARQGRFTRTRLEQDPFR